MRELVLLLWALLALPALASEEVVLGLSKNQVSITTNFDGSEILVFGAVKRDAPIPEGDPLQVIVAVSGPSMPVTVRRKEKRFGIWVNTDAVEVDAAPSFYAINTSAPLDDVLRAVEDQRHKISIPQAIRSVGAPQNISDAGAFTQSLIRIRKKSNLYQLNEDAVTVEEQTLFRTSIRLPAALTEGGYDTRIFLTRGGSVVAQYETVIDVRKVGLERWLFTMSREQSLLYGLMSLAIAIAAGWGASAIFTLLRR
ncbi:TIGR02186 family protein [Sulfitobacter albidus]|uniref:TIGR02186 family protein n=1 Tax=Sulfitobacter albidus TaxID=2829501 RepID=A0A975JEA4_9RHOB|nr:TIGR02186 family protein [Sulfitobacter albidus]QUJ76906.1 TIGR02186 family protein [Sulfitobacter albidus]